MDTPFLVKGGILGWDQRAQRSTKDSRHPPRGRRNAMTASAWMELRQGLRKSLLRTPADTSTAGSMYII